jgi:hypothetical protein
VLNFSLFGSMDPAAGLDPAISSGRIQPSRWPALDAWHPASLNSNSKNLLLSWRFGAKALLPPYISLHTSQV